MTTKTAVVVFDQVGFQNDPKQPPSYAVRGEEIELSDSEYKRLRDLGAVGTPQDAIRAEKLSAITPAADFDALAAEHRKVMDVSTATDDPDVAAAEGAHPDEVSELRDKAAQKAGASRGGVTGPALSAEEQKQAAKTDADRKASRPARGESEPD